jgi:chromosome segregation ATPase
VLDLLQEASRTAEGSAAWDWRTILVAGALLALSRADTVYRLLRGGRAAERKDADDAAERRVKPYREEADALRGTLQTLQAQLSLLQAEKLRVEGERDQCETENRRLRQTERESAGLQSIVNQLRGELDAMDARLSDMERRPRHGGGGQQ